MAKEEQAGPPRITPSCSLLRFAEADALVAGHGAIGDAMMAGRVVAGHHFALYSFGVRHAYPRHSRPRRSGAVIGIVQDALAGEAGRGRRHVDARPVLAFC